MILTIACVLVLAGFVAWAVHVDLKRGEQRRRAREAKRATYGKLPPNLRTIAVTLTANMAGFNKAMAQAADSMASFEKAYAAASQPGQRWRNAAYPNLMEATRCRWCQVLGRVGLSHHAMHYIPRHRRQA